MAKNGFLGKSAQWSRTVTL